MTCLALVFRNGVRLEESTKLALLLLENDYSYKSYDSVLVPADDFLREEDLRIANGLEPA